MWEQASTPAARADIEQRAEQAERGMRRWKQQSRQGFSRHEGWGGDAGKGWAERKTKELDKETAMRSDTYKEIAQRIGMETPSETQTAMARSDTDRLIPWLQNALSFANDGDFVMAKRYAKRFVEAASAAGFSRPGAKAVMAMTVAQAEQIITTIDERKASQTSWSPAMDHLTKQRDFAQRLIVAHRQGDTANIKRYSALLEKAGW
jgi:hypothetical protein